MDLLINQCAILSINNNPLEREWYNNTQINLYANTTIDGEDHVYTNNFIENGKFIGELEGERKYAWEVIPEPYIIWVTDEWVIDCTNKPRCILSMIRESHYEGLQANCEWILYASNDETKFSLFAKKDIQPYEELICYFPENYY